MRGPTSEGRVAALRYVYGQEKAPAPAVLRAVMERVGPQEPVVAARQWALRVLARFGGYGVTGLVRHLVKDPDTSVRITAVDALVGLAEQDAAARAAAILVLGPLSESPDRGLGAAARMATVELAGGDLGAAADQPGAAGDEARRKAFAAWWAGPVGVEARIRSLEAFPKVKDRAADDVIFAYVADPDFGVLVAAYRALDASRPVAGPAPFLAWWNALPRFTAEQLVPARRAEIVAALEAWRRAKPR
jgi:hypothetical protein